MQGNRSAVPVLPAAPLRGSPPAATEQLPCPLIPFTVACEPSAVSRQPLTVGRRPISRQWQLLYPGLLFVQEQESLSEPLGLMRRALSLVLFQTYEPRPQ